MSMIQSAKSYCSSAAALLLAIMLAASFTGSVMGAEGRLPSRLLPDAVELAVTTSIGTLPALRARP
jgi:hypothetical protein